MIKVILKTLKNITSHPLNKSRKLRAINNFVKWQIASRLFNVQFIIPWIDDCKFIIKNGETGLSSNLYSGLAEYNDMAFVLHSLRKSDHFVDVGANVGAYTLIASKVIGCKTSSFEPIPDTFKRLTEQVDINQVNDLVSAFNIGIGEERATLKFTANNNTTNKVIVDSASSDEEYVSIPVEKLDDKISKEDYLFIKIDVEGYEQKVLNGAVDILTKGKVLAIILELNESGIIYGYKDTDTHKFLTTLGYEAYKYEPLSKQLIKLNTHNLSKINTIYIKQIDVIQERLANSRSFKIHTLDGLLI